MPYFAKYLANQSMYYLLYNFINPDNRLWGKSFNTVRLPFKRLKDVDIEAHTIGSNKY